jgi:hypothetical protein
MPQAADQAFNVWPLLGGFKILKHNKFHNLLSQSFFNGHTGFFFFIKIFREGLKIYACV